MARGVRDLIAGGLKEWLTEISPCLEVRSWLRELQNVPSSCFLQVYKGLIEHHPF